MGWTAHHRVALAKRSCERFPQVTGADGLPIRCVIPPLLHDARLVLYPLKMSGHQVPLHVAREHAQDFACISAQDRRPARPSKRRKGEVYAVGGG
jgi:hypothetical protein